MNSIRPLGYLSLAALLVIAGCKRPEAPVPAASAPVAAATGADHADSSARPPGIDWFEGDVTAAFAAAKAENKPVLLYWGALWCPPCHLLKATVFKQPDFQEKTKLFIPVYLDGDEAGAQLWGEKFKVSGYPTLVALRPDGTEIKRISGGLDLNRYGSMLDEALEDQRPVMDVLAAVAKSASAATPESCRRVAWNAWDLDVAFIARDPGLGHQLLTAAEHCAKAGTALELRLRLYAAAALAPDYDRARGPAPFDAASKANARRLEAMLADTAAASLELDALRNLAPEFFAAYSAHDQAAALRLAKLCEAAELAAAEDPRYPRADQLGAILVAQEMRGALTQDDAEQMALEKYTRTRVAAEMANLPEDPYLRSGVVMAVLECMDALGDHLAAYDIAKREVESSPYAYYFMSDMAHISEQLGREGEALDWYERAYRESKGPATRFQWGTSYLLAVLRLAPDDVERVRKAGHDVLAELDNQGGVHSRSRTRLNRVDGKLAEWTKAAPAKRDPVAKELRAIYSRDLKS